jgi:hypothetical protein
MMSAFVEEEVGYQFASGITHHVAVDIHFAPRCQLIIAPGGKHLHKVIPVSPAPSAHVLNRGELIVADSL